MTRLPHENSYLVAPRLIAGEYPAADAAQAAARIQAHLDAGITSFVDLTAELELEPYAPLLPSAVRHTRLTIPDMSVPALPADMVTILDTIDRELADGRTVYLHCWGGIGRTGTVVGCWFVRHGMDGETALEEVMRRFRTVAKYPSRPRSPETSAQEHYIRTWHETP